MKFVCFVYCGYYFQLTKLIFLRNFHIYHYKESFASTNNFKTKNITPILTVFKRKYLKVEQHSLYFETSCIDNQNFKYFLSRSPCININSRYIMKIALEKNVFT
jgi:hypothetical protein